jgi:hypothetical protein
MDMKLGILATAILLTIGFAVAQPVKEHVGPYMISFTVPVPVSINTQTTHNETNDGTAYTSYKLTVININDSRQATIITVNSYAKRQNPLTEKNMSDAIISVGDSVHVTFSRQVDGKTAVMAEAYYAPVAVFEYAWAYNRDKEGKERVTGLSSFPWDTGTTEILDTLHIVSWY